MALGTRSTHGKDQCSGYNTALKQSRNQLGVEDAHTSSGLSSNANSTTLTKESGARLERNARHACASSTDRRPALNNRDDLTQISRNGAIDPSSSTKEMRKSTRSCR